MRTGEECRITDQIEITETMPGTVFELRAELLWTC
jgi:hypothetical protein